MIDLRTMEPTETYAVHHDGDKWTEEELEKIGKFKQIVKMRRKKTE